MALVKWEPRKELEPFRSLRTEIDHLFDDFTRGWPRAFFGGALPTEMGEFFPLVDLKESDDAYTLTADLPGIQKDDLRVNITETMVTLKGERREEKEKTLRGYHIKEASYGSFERTIALPGEVVADKAKATMSEGVLTLVLPKTKENKKKQVEVKID